MGSGGAIGIARTSWWPRISSSTSMARRQAPPAWSAWPDLLVAFGVPKQARRNYPLWEVGKAPDFVLEILSPLRRQAALARSNARSFGDAG